MPRQLVAAIDVLSKRKGISRSRFISSVLFERITEEKEGQIREAYDRVFSDDAIKKEQLEMADWYGKLENEEGQEW